MRRSWLLGLMGGFWLLLLAPSAHARKQTQFFVDPFPGEFKEIVKKIYNLDPGTGAPPPKEGENEVAIPPYLEGSQCGGWDKDISVGTVLAGTGKVARVTGVPGRSGQPLGALQTGMSKKDPIYQFPGLPTQTRGLATNCSTNLPFTIRQVWRPIVPNAPIIRLMPVMFTHPRFIDPPCRWRMASGPGEDATPINPPIPLPDNKIDFNYRLFTTKPLDRESPGNCRTFCDYLNMFQYRDCKAPVATPLGITCAEWANRYLCSEEWVLSYPLPSCISENMATPGPNPLRDLIGNSTFCSGAGCRCPAPPFPQGPLAPSCHMTPGNRGPVLPGGVPTPRRPLIFRSYYRRYLTARYERGALQTAAAGVQRYVPAEVTQKNAGVACYGFYDEFNPLHRRTQGKDRRCVINIDVSELRRTQVGKAEYGQHGQWPDPNPLSSGQMRDGGVFTPADDLWFKNLGKAFSFLNEKIFQEKYGSDLVPVLLDIDNLDRADLTSIYPLTPTRLTADGDLVFPVDDTGTGTVWRWWQKQQTEFSTISRPPVIHFVLPTQWAEELQKDKTIIVGKNEGRVRVTEATGTGRLQSVDVQVQAGDDILGTVIRHLERSSSIRFQYEPVPIVVPMGSPTEFRALAQAWCEWFMQSNQTKTCDDDGPTGDLITMLESYADHIEETRRLRAELPRHAGELLALRERLEGPLRQWLKENKDKARALDLERDIIRLTILPFWMSAMRSLNRVHDEVNHPWCMNQRFTHPIYSMLDPWLPARQEGGSTYPYGSRENVSLPDLGKAGVEPQDNTIVDLSYIRTMTGSVKIPVLRPLQLRLDLPRPPSVGSSPPSTPLPALPDLSPIQQMMRETVKSFPTIQESKTKVEPKLPTPMGFVTLARVGIMTMRINQAMSGMLNRYEKFWTSITPLREPPANGKLDPKYDDTADPDDTASLKQRFECWRWDSDTCQHVEMDLIERLTRIGARPFILLKEDYQTTGWKRLFPGVCLPWEDMCNMLRSETILPDTFWEFGNPTRQPQIMDLLREGIRQKTLPAPLGSVPQEELPPYDSNSQQERNQDPELNLEDIGPSLSIPPGIDLTPPKPPPL